METMKIPGPDHRIEIKAHPRRVRAHYRTHVIADSADVLALREAGYRPVFYFPRSDVSMEYLSRTQRDTHCPYKGHAAYFTLMMDGAIAENAAWTYEGPYPAMAAIDGRIAFFPNAVDIQEAEVVAAGATPDEVVRHTDAGAGASQAEHWPTTAPNPDARK
ncbi:MAG TPA: DUF427 domain-containing protein [Caulobacteraceae bacterium]